MATPRNWTQRKIFLHDQVSVDIFAISPESTHSPAAMSSAHADFASSSPEFATTFAVGEEAETSAPANASQQSATPISLLTAPMNRSTRAVRRGGTYRVDVVVRTRGVGHFFPGGTVDAFDCWLALEATDDTGRVIFWSGTWKMAAKVRWIPARTFIARCRSTGTATPSTSAMPGPTRAVVYVHLIPPGAADTVHYRFKFRSNAGGHIHFNRATELPQIRLVEYAIFLRWRARPEPANPRGRPDFDDTPWVFTGDASRVPGGAQRNSRSCRS